MPYPHDEDQSVTAAYRAACTPDFFLFDGDRKLVYRGQLSQPPRQRPPGDRLGSPARRFGRPGRRPVAEDQRPSLGCNIKWKPGNEPDYF